MLKGHKLETVKDVLVCGWKDIAKIRNAGPETVDEIKNKIKWIVTHKKEIQGKSGQQLAQLMSGELKMWSHSGIC